MVEVTQYATHLSDLQYFICYRLNL